MPLTKDWHCPKCGLDIHEPVRVRAATHQCYGPADHQRTVPVLVALHPVTDWSAPVGRATQLTLEGAA